MFNGETNQENPDEIYSNNNVSDYDQIIEGENIIHGVLHSLVNGKAKRKNLKAEIIRLKEEASNQHKESTTTKTKLEEVSIDYSKLLDNYSKEKADHKKTKETSHKLGCDYDALNNTHIQYIKNQSDVNAQKDQQILEAKSAYEKLIEENLNLKNDVKKLNTQDEKQKEMIEKQQAELVKAHELKVKALEAFSKFKILKPHLPKSYNIEGTYTAAYLAEDKNNEQNII